MNVNNNINPNVRGIVSDVGIITDRPAVFEPQSSLFADELRAASSRAQVDLDPIFRAAAIRYDLPLDLLTAVARAESNFRQNAVSPAGAMGIMQLMPNTAQHLGVTDPFDPQQNIMGGARYLREQLDRFDGDVRLALAAYNAGWPTVQRHGGIPPFSETQKYVARIMGWLGENETADSAMAHLNSINGFGAIPTSLTLGNVGADASALHQSSAGAQTAESAVNIGALTSMLSEMLVAKMMNLQMSMGTSNNNRTIF